MIMVNSPYKEFVMKQGYKVGESFKTMAIDGAKWIGLLIIDNSHLICLGCAMGGLILYLGGYKKGAKVVTISLIVYLVLQAMGVCIR